MLIGEHLYLQTPETIKFLLGEISQTSIIYDWTCDKAHFKLLRKLL